MKRLVILAMLLAAPTTFGQQSSAPVNPPGAAPALKAGTYAKFETSVGNFTAELYPQQAPVTVANFIGLVRGTKEWKDPKSGATMKNKPFYNGLTFHRIISDFMIQGGDPLGTGTGNPGYKIQDEFSKVLKHDRPGRIAMAHSSLPNSAGSQFYITVKPYPSLDGQYAIFGQVVEGMDVVMAISKVKTSPGDKPVTPVIMKKVTIEVVK